MPRYTPVIALLGMAVGSSLVAATPFDQEKQHRDADCDSGCFFGSFPGGSCTNDAACMCTQQKYREKYFCCMAEKCDASVLPDSIQRQTLECEARNMPFTFDTEAVCGIKLSTKLSTYSTQTVTVTATVGGAEGVATGMSGSTVTGAATTETETGFRTKSASAAVTSASPGVVTGTSAAEKNASIEKVAKIAAALAASLGLCLW